MNSHPENSPATGGFARLDFNSRSLSWGAILAGAVGALAIQVVLMMLGAGLGLAMYDPISSEDPIANPGIGAVVIQGITSVLSLWGGGWIAGRFSAKGGRFSGLLHGFMVWCVATVVAIYMVSASAGWAMGTMSNVVGGGLSMAGKPVAAAVGGATDMAEEAIGQESNMLESFLEEGMSNAPDNQTDGEAIRAKRDLGFALTRLVAADESNRVEREQKVVTLLVENQGMGQAEARQMVDNWTGAYEELKSDLAAAKETVVTQAREVADETASTLAILALCGFVSFVIGAIAASLGGKHGCEFACKDDDEAVSPRH